MGDFYQTIVVSDVDIEEAPKLAEAMRSWLIREGIVNQEYTACLLGEDFSGHSPGVSAANTTEFPEDFEHVWGLQVNGLEIQVGRQAFQTNSLSMTCSQCGQMLDSEMVDYAEEIGIEGIDERLQGMNAAVDAWYESDDVTYTCSFCGRTEPVAKWDCSFGLGNLGFTFWNWPPFNEDFLQRFEQKSGYKTRHIVGKL